MQFGLIKQGAQGEIGAKSILPGSTSAVHSWRSGI
jgi:hypothetical protein